MPAAIDQCEQDLAAGDLTDESFIYTGLSRIRGIGKDHPEAGLPRAHDPGLQHIALGGIIALNPVASVIEYAQMEESISPGPPFSRSSPKPPVEKIILQIAKQRIRSSATRQGVIPGIANQRAGTGIAKDQIIIGAAVQRGIARAAMDRVAAALAQKAVVTCAPIEQIIATPSAQRIVAAMTPQ